jgi:hypothetical protein
MNRVFTEKEVSEIQLAEAVLRDSGLDVDHEYANHNANIIMDYFEKNPRVPVTVQSIRAVVDSQKTSFAWRTAAQREFDKIAAENPAAAQQLANWMATTQGKPGTLVKEGGQYFENLSLLLIELRGRPVDSQRIHEAIGRISFKPGRQLHYLPEPRKQDPRQHQDNGEPFLGKVNVNEPHWKRVQREREEHEAAETKPGAAASAQSAAAREAQRQATQLRGNSHSEDAQLQAIFVTIPGTSEINWPDTLAARLNLQKSLNKEQEVRRFIR